MLSHVTFTGWDRHTDLDELRAFLGDYPQERVEIAVLYSESHHDDDRYPHPIKAEQILRVAKAAGQHAAVHLCGKAAREFLESTQTEPSTVQYPLRLRRVMDLADRVQVNVPEEFWQIDG